MKELQYLNRQFTTNKIEAVIKKSPNKRSVADSFTDKYYWIFKEELIPFLLKLFQKCQEEGRLPNSFYEVSIILIPKPDKDATKKVIGQ